MQATIPYFLEQIEQDTVKQGNSMVAVKHEISIYTTLCVEMKALVNCCDILARFILLIFAGIIQVRIELVYLILLLDDF